MPPCSGLISGKELSSLYFILKCNVNLGRMYQLPLTYLELTTFIGIMQGVLPNYIFIYNTYNRFTPLSLFVSTWKIVK